ncbi:MAG TPA: CBS domain-containing protein [Spirochaetota bacterium]|nr:CBS domain-containing protein [Spirochaetota bacterium]
MTDRARHTSFIYLSQIINLPVVDGKSVKIGRLYDVIADVHGMYPRINALVVRKGIRKQLIYYPWKSIHNILVDRRIVVDDANRAKEPFKLSPNELRLRETFWDRQIVDIAGSKVVRVNDLHILKDGIKLWLVHVDVGFKGLLRRLGWLRFFNSAVKWLFAYELKDKFISWKFVQPITAVDDVRSLSLRVPSSKLSQLHPADLADILIDLGAEERMLIFNSFDDATASDILQELPLKMRLMMAKSLEHDRLARILDETPMDEVVDLLDEMPYETVSALYRLLPEEKVAQIKTLLKHSDRIAGSLMNTEFVSAQENETAAKVLRRIKKVAEDIESIYYIYVLNDMDVPIGVLTLKQLLRAGAGTPIREIMRGNVVRVKIDTHIKLVAQIFYKYNFTVVPVVDEFDRIQGIITIKDALEPVFPEIREETEEV